MGGLRFDGANRVPLPDLVVHDEFHEAAGCSRQRDIATLDDAQRSGEFEPFAIEHLERASGEFVLNGEFGDDRDPAVDDGCVFDRVDVVEFDHDPHGDPEAAELLVDLLTDAQVTREGDESYLR